MDAEEIKRLDKMHIMHPWVVNDTFDPWVVDRTDGLYIIDSQGRKLLDFASQLKCVNVGHSNPKIIAAIQKQVEKVCFVSGAMAYESRAKLGQSLAEVTPGDLNRFFFTLGGADAVENAIKFARASSGKQKIIALYRSYHGSTYGAVSLTGDSRRTWAEPSVPGAVHALNPFCYRCHFGLEHPQCGLRCADHIADIIAYEDPGTVAAVIVEPVTGAGGIIIPPDGYMQRLRKICDRNDILLIADEVMAGFGRTGKWFAMQHWDVVPDIMTMAKGLTSSYLPLGAVAMSDKVSRALSKEALSCGLTYNAHPVCCAAACAAIEVYHDEKLVQNAAALGAILKTELNTLKNKHVSVGDVRSIGLFACLELVQDRDSKTPLSPKHHAGQISKRLLQKGVYSPVAAGQPGFFLYVAPPLTIGEQELRQGLAVVDEVLEHADTLTAS